jgi:hypothetical protein
LTILVGSSSLANARTARLEESAAEPASATVSATRRLPASDWRHTIGPSEHPIRLSLDGPNTTAFAPRRPIRITLEAPPTELSTLETPPQEPVSVDAPGVPEPSPAESADEPAGNSEVDFAARPLRLSLDQAQRGAIGVTRVARPIRLELDGEPVVPAPPRPYRSVLE